MALIFERIQTEGIAELSDLVGDDSEGVVAVFDPRADVDSQLGVFGVIFAALLVAGLFAWEGASPR